MTNNAVLERNCKFFIWAVELSSFKVQTPSPVLLYISPQALQCLVNVLRSVVEWYMHSIPEAIAEVPAGDSGADIVVAAEEGTLSVTEPGKGSVTEEADPGWVINAVPGNWQSATFYFQFLGWKELLGDPRGCRGDGAGGQEDSEVSKIQN